MASLSDYGKCLSEASHKVGGVARTALARLINGNVAYGGIRAYFMTSYCTARKRARHDHPDQYHTQWPHEPTG